MGQLLAIAGSLGEARIEAQNIVGPVDKLRSDVLYSLPVKTLEKNERELRNLEAKAGTLHSALAKAADLEQSFILDREDRSEQGLGNHRGFIFFIMFCMYQNSPFAGFLVHSF
jgi:hypothetical protein